MSEFNVGDTIELKIRAKLICGPKGGALHLRLAEGDVKFHFGLQDSREGKIYVTSDCGVELKPNKGEIETWFLSARDIFMSFMEALEKT